MSLRAFLGISIAAFAASAYAEWGAVNEIDAFTDEQVRFAFYSDAEHRIQFSREVNGVYMFVTRKKIGTFDPEGTIEVRVDSNPLVVHDPAKAKAMDELLAGVEGVDWRPMFVWEPDTVGFLVWHGKESETCGFIGQLIEGRELRVRYWTSSLDRDAFNVSLAGAREALVEGLGLKICGR